MMDPKRPARSPSGCEARERADGEVVDDIDRVLLGEQTIDEMGADETRSPDDDDVHQKDRSAGATAWRPVTTRWQVPWR